MKRAILLMALLLILSSTSFAQVPKPFNLYFGGGMTFSSAPQEFRDYHKEGYHLTAGIGFNFIPLVQFVGKAEYHSFSKDFDEFLPDITDLEGGTQRLVTFGVDARLGAGVPTAPIKPFLFGGIGLARISQSDLLTAFTELLPEEEIAFLDQESETKFYFNIGGGLEFKALTVLNLFIQGRYVNIKQEGDNLVYIPLTVGLKF
jgi:opacity protein-like surface antigen